MKILGIDPGTTLIGFGVIEKVGSKFTCLEYGVIKNTGKDKFFDFKKTSKEVSDIISRHSPEVCGIEKLFFFKNQKTIMSVSEMKGVIMHTIDNHGIPIHEFTPLQVKQAVSTYGRAEKDQVQRMVKLILGIKEPIKPDDAADGLAIAICCANNIVYSIK